MEVAMSGPRKRSGFSRNTSRVEDETWQDRVRGRDAAIEITLAIAAAAVGMTAFAIVFHYAAAHAGV
jgi:hypothetical protein